MSTLGSGLHAVVAQLEERRSASPKVEGSSPFYRSIKPFSSTRRTRRTACPSGGPRPRFEQVGVTEDGKPIIKGAFRMVDTHGVPLEVVISFLDNNGRMPSWADFYDNARKAGWKSRGIVAKLRNVVGDVYGPDFREGWELRMQAHIDKTRAG